MPNSSAAGVPSHQNDTINYLFWNCNYLSRSVDALHATLLTHASSSSSPLPLYHLFAFAETKLDAARALPSIAHYDWYTKPHRANSGGLACLIHDSIAVREVDASHPSLSALSRCMSIGVDADDSSAVWWLELHPSHVSTPMLLAVVYLRPPVTSIVLHKLQRCINTAVQLWPSDRPMLILGDFNLRHSSLGDAFVADHGSVDRVAESFVQYLEDNDLTVLNRQLLPPGSYTRPASRAMLDLAITNPCGLNWCADMHVGALDLPLVSDHQCIVVRCRAPSIHRMSSNPSASWEVPRIDWRLDRLQSEEGQRIFREELERRLLTCFPFDELDPHHPHLHQSVYFTSLTRCSD